MNRTRVAVVALVGLLLAGCSAAPASGGSNGSGQSGATGGGSSQSSDASTESSDDTGVPVGFPAEIPLVAGDVPFGYDLGTGWTVVVEVDDIAVAFAEASTQLKAAGFDATVETIDTAGSFGAYDSDRYQVQVTAADTPDYGPNVTYLVVTKS